MLRTPSPAWAVPVLETPRLHLRAHTLADYPAYTSLWADPIVVRYIGGRPFSPEETWARLLRHAGHWSLLGFGSWLIEEKSTGDLVGEVGLFDYHRAITPPLDTPEIGWILSPSKHGRGYATEAVHALLDWGRDRFLSPTLSCIIHPGNAASLRVAAKCGFAPLHTITYRDEPSILLTRNFPA
jgi:RimJ/RimL family protein N-acetyltransferase